MRPRCATPVTATIIRTSTSTIRTSIGTALVLLAAVAAVLAPSSGAYAADGGLGAQVRGDGSGRPVVTLTNNGAQPCQVVASAEGTVVATRVEQDGAVIEPIPIIPSYDDDLGYQLSQRLATLAPGASVELPLNVVAAGPTGHALRTVSWSPLAAIGALYPMDPTKPLTFDFTYSVPILVASQPPLCAPAQGSGVAGPGEGTADSVTWIIAAGAAVILLLVLVVVLVLLARRRRRRTTATAAAAVAVIMAAGLAAVGWHPEPAQAKITAGPGVEEAVAGCLASMRAPGGDPRNILPTLEDPSVNVTIQLDTSGSNGENRFDPQNIFVYWNPNDRRPYADGVPREPCDSLYHELYHAFEDTTPEGVDLHECITADGPSGISIKEVNATKAENARRANFGRKQRTKYGDNALPPGECRPPTPDTPLCHPSRGCPKPPQKPAQSASDPHLKTFDERRYSFQAMGEFVATRSTVGDPATAFQVQVRQQPLPPNRYITRNSAVVANVAGDRVEVRLVQGRLVLLVNGAEQALASTSLPKGGGVIHSPGPRGDMITVDWPDGSYALVASFRTSLTLIVVPAQAHAGKLTGLLGDYDGDPANDTPGGGDPARPPQHEDLYPGYADSMRVTQQASLFTYEPGTNTDTYTDRSFPDRMPDALPNQAWAESLCRQFGVSDPISLTECVVDVANTGMADFVAASIAAQAGAASFRVGGSGSTLGIARPGDISTVHFAGTAGQRLYVDVVSTTLPNACGVLSLRDPTGKVLGSGCVINGRGGIDALTLPVTGGYSVVVDPHGDATGEITIRLVTPTDQESGLSIDGAEVNVSIAAAGAIGRLTFTANAGQIVYVDIPSSSLPNACGILSIVAPDDTRLASGCVINGNGFIDRTALPTTGTYTVVIDPPETVTGDARVRVIGVVDHNASITPDGPDLTATIARPGSVALLTFTGAAGQKVFVDVPSSTLDNACGLLSLRDPAGKILTSGCVINGKGHIDRTVLPQAGTYTVRVDPAEARTGEARMRLIVAADQSGTLTIGGATVTATLAKPGSIARFTFTGTAGQKVILDVTSATIENQCGLLFLRDPADKTLITGCVINGSGGIDSFTLPSSGTYAIVVDPSENATGQATLRLHT